MRNFWNENKQVGSLVFALYLVSVSAQAATDDVAAVAAPDDKAVTQVEAASAENVGNANAAKATLKSFSWLTGKWRTKSGDGHFEEHWSDAAGGMIIGMGREVKGGKLSFFEYLRVEQRKDGIFYVAQPFGKPGTDFKLTECSESVYRFENPTHDFPKRIEYTRRQDGSVEVCGTGDAKDKEQAFQFVLYKE